LRERRRLLELAPHLVHPLPFLFPVFEGDPTGLVKLGAGMWLYDTLALFRTPQRHRLLRREAVRREEPELRSDGLRGGAVYYDAQVDDARLTLSVARAAHESGVVIVTHAPVVALELRSGSLGQATVRDALTGQEVRVRARLVVNAAGPWSDRVRRLADPSVKPRLRTTKGVHILLERGRVQHRHAIIFRSAVDGRVMFVLPWGEFTYIGTTDTEYRGDPDAVVADAADVRYLLDSANALFPAARLGTTDIVSTWAGVRPLLTPAILPERSTSATSREHRWATSIPSTCRYRARPNRRSRCSSRRLPAACRTWGCRPTERRI
jgi:glycerol-3-phosphate dehydrogenase